MPAQYGLYTSFMPPLMYWIFGTCQQMSFGVTAIESTLLGQAVDKIIGTTGHQNNKKAKQYDFDYRVM
jgi:MFS superfamily sulfate permease-like transporter